MKKLWAFLSTLLFLLNFLRFSSFSFFLVFLLLKNASNFISLQFHLSLTLAPFILCFILLYLRIQCIYHGLFLWAKIDFANCIALSLLRLMWPIRSCFLRTWPTLSRANQGWTFGPLFVRTRWFGPLSRWRTRLCQIVLASLAQLFGRLRQNSSWWWEHEVHF